MTDVNEPRADQLADLGEPPDDDLDPTARSVPEGEPDPEEYEPDDPDIEAIVDGGRDPALDPDVSYPYLDGEEPGPEDGDEP